MLIETQDGQPQSADSPKQPKKLSRVTKWSLWILASLVLLFVGVGLIGAAMLQPRIEATETALNKALPLSSQVKDEILSGETEKATRTVARLSALSAEAVSATDYFLWDIAEKFPIAGENLKAVRMVSQIVFSLSTDVLEPATEVNLTALQTEDGSFDVERIASLLPLVQTTSADAQSAILELDSINEGFLVEPVKNGVLKLKGSLTKLLEIVGPAEEVLGILPQMLGSDGPRNYLFMFPNNAEIRAGGGNPASLSIITVDNGHISITQQASSADFRRITLPINPETEALYDTRTRQMMQDATYTPYFSETAELMRGHWADSFGTPIDGVVSFDPVALSYLLKATGPVTLPTGEQLTSENAVSLLLNEVYFNYPVSQQDAFFAGAAESVFDALTQGNTDIRQLLDALVLAVDEGRLMYSSHNEQEMKIINKTRIAGPLPATNQDTTVLGVFFNYVLAAKMDYYLDSTVTGSTTLCTVKPGEQPTFSATATVTNILTPDQAGSLPGYVMASNGGSAIYRDVMFYGPVGTQVSSVQVDGNIQQPFNRWPNDYRVLSHNGRNVVQIPLLVGMGETATVSVTFTATQEQSLDSFGPFDIRATPTVRTTPVTITSPSCKS